MQVQRFTRITTAALAAAALASPAAQAMPDYGAGNDAQVAVAPERVAPSPERVSLSPEPIRVPGPTVVVEAGEPSFEWASAGIGAGVLLALIALGFAATTAGRHLRLRPTH